MSKLAGKNILITGASQGLGREIALRCVREGAAADARHYYEPFGGSAAVLINRKPADVETYNDIDSEVANFFACLRKDGEELIRHIDLTPFSLEELVRAHKPDRGLTQLEHARRFFVRARQTRTGLAQTSSEGLI